MIINKFADWLKENRWFSTTTVEIYKRILVSFDNYLRSISLWRWGIEKCENIKLMHVNSYVQKLKLQSKSSRTCNNHIACIKNFLKYCLVVWYKVEDYRRILYIKEVKKKIDCLSDDECKKLLNYFRKAKCWNSDRWELIKTRNLCIVQLLLYTWLRVSELASIKIRDVKKELQIIWKWGKRRVVYLYDEDMKMIDLYLFLRKDNSEWLFVSHSSNSEWRRLSRISIEYIIREWARDAGIEWKVFPHKLRHTFATSLLRNKADITHIQALLWHNSITTTQTYLTVLNNELEQTQRLVTRY